MRWCLICLTLVLFPISSLAQQLPALFSVANIKEDEFLNIFAEIDRNSEVIATFPWDARDIEITALNETGDWGQININERAGWVEMQFLEEQFLAGSSLLPRPLICFGNEPFWTLDVGLTPFAELGWLDGETVRFSGLHTISSASREGRYMMIAENNGKSLHGFVERKTCSDGMSDRVYGLDMNLLVRDGRETRYFAGCCSISP